MLKDLLVENSKTPLSKKISNFGLSKSKKNLEEIDHKLSFLAEKLKKNISLKKSLPWFYKK